MVAQNIIANFLGKFWLFTITVVAVPVYIAFVGVEAFGLIGFFSVLLATLQVLELGLGVVINREIAKTRLSPERFQNTRDLFRSLEVIYWVVGLFLSIVIYLSAPFIASEWLNSEHQETAAIENAIRLMGLTIAFSWPTSLYAGCLMGLEKQVLLNLLQIAFASLRTGGAMLVLWQVSPTLEAFFLWQLAASAISTITFAIVCWRVLPHRLQSAKFNISTLRDVWRFAVGLGATTIATFLLSNFDKLVLSKTLSLSEFAGYNVANQMNAASRLIPAAVFQALFPRFSSLYAKNDQGAIVAMYHKGSQFIALVVFPTSMSLAMFSAEILQLWLRNEQVAGAAAGTASVLLIGSALNAALGIPYVMTVARGWSMYGFYQNLVSAIIIVPLMLFLVSLYGAMGAAFSWLILNVGYLIVAAPIIARRTVPKGELFIFYTHDIGKPFVVCLAVSAMTRWALPESLSSTQQIFWIVGSWLLVQAACFSVLPKMVWQVVTLIRVEFLNREGL